jgi:hypothetical protein
MIVCHALVPEARPGRSPAEPQTSNVDHDKGRGARTEAASTAISFHDIAGPRTGDGAQAHLSCHALNLARQEIRG